MTSTFTSNINLQLQGTGDNVNTWGSLLNTAVFANIDQALGSPYAANVAGSADVTLSQTNALNLVHNLTGILTGNINYIFPASAGRIVVINNGTTGAFTVTVKASGGAGVTVVQGHRQVILLDSAANTAYSLADPLTNANLTGPITSVGNTTSIASQTGTGTTFAMQAVPSFSTTIGVGATTAAASGAGISFPATQSASTDANTLDDYEEGTWTPSISAGTVGNLSVAYTTQVGQYTKIGKQVNVLWSVVTSSFTYTTASGQLLFNGFPFTSSTLSGHSNTGSLVFQGITKAGYTQFIPLLAQANATASISASGTAAARADLTITDLPTGGAVQLYGSLTYQASS